MRQHKIKSSISMGYLIRNVDIWNPHGIEKKTDLQTVDGIVTKISKHLTNPDTRNFFEIDGSGLVLMPAGVDAQVHLRVPGQAHKETASSGLWAAVAGGVGALLTMPNTKPVLDSVEVLNVAKKEVAPVELATGVKVLFSAAMTMGQNGRQCVNFHELAEAGVAAFTDDGVGVASDNVMADVIRGASQTGLPILQHAEVPGHGGVLAAGPIQDKIGGVAYPASAEFEMVARDLDLLKLAPSTRYHVLHVSAAETILQVKRAKANGLNVTCEVSPHHLFFTSNDIDPSNTSFKMNPPIRSGADRESLREALANGDCDFMATDHAPHEDDVKTANFKTSAFGTTGLETSLRVLIDLWQKEKLSATRFVEIWSTSPAAFLGISSRFGTIGEGRPLNAVLCDVHAPPTPIMKDDFLGLSKNSCFMGVKLPGKIKATFLETNIHQMDFK